MIQLPKNDLKANYNYFLRTLVQLPLKPNNQQRRIFKKNIIASANKKQYLKKKLAIMPLLLAASKVTSKVAECFITANIKIIGCISGLGTLFLFKDPTPTFCIKLLVSKYIQSTNYSKRYMISQVCNQSQTNFRYFNLLIKSSVLTRVMVWEHK